MDTTRSPLETLEAMYVEMAELRKFAEAEWDDMTPGEQAESDEVTAKLEDAADSFADSFYYEILLERIDATRGKLKEYIAWSRDALARNDIDEAQEWNNGARDLITLIEIQQEMLVTDKVS